MTRKRSKPLVSQVVGVPGDVVEQGARRAPVLVGEGLVHALLRVVARGNGVPPVLHRSAVSTMDGMRRQSGAYVVACCFLFSMFLFLLYTVAVAGLQQPAGPSGDFACRTALEMQGDHTCERGLLNE